MAPAAPRVLHRAVKAAKVKVVVGLVAARGSGWMVRSGETTVCLSSSRLCSSVDLPDELLPSTHGDGRQLHRAAVAPGLEVLEMELDRSWRGHLTGAEV